LTRRKVLGGVEDLREHRARQALDAEQVDELAVRGRAAGGAAISISRPRSRTKREAAVGAARQRQPLPGRQAAHARGSVRGRRWAARGRRGPPAPPGATLAGRPKS
jgi:hypothetical protein